MKPTLSTDALYGRSDTGQLLLGKGKLLFDLYVNDTATNTYIDLGNAPSFAMNVEEETLDHTTSRSGLATVDATVILSKTIGGSFTLEEQGANQLAMYLSGQVFETAAHGGSGGSYASGSSLDLQVPDNAGGSIIPLATAGGVRYRKITGFSISNLDTAGTNYTSGTDYVVDLDAGYVHIIAGGGLDGTSIAAFARFTYSGGTNLEVRIGQSDQVTGAIFFAGTDARTGRTYEALLHKCKISADGDLPFISDEWAQTNFTFTAEDDSANNPNSPIGTITAFAAS